MNKEQVSDCSCVVSSSVQHGSAFGVQDGPRDRCGRPGLCCGCGSGCSGHHVQETGTLLKGARLPQSTAALISRWCSSSKYVVEAISARCDGSGV